jgi:hypothetical protein
LHLNGNDKEALYCNSDLRLRKHLDPRYLKCHKNNPQEENDIKKDSVKRNNHEYVQLKIMKINLIISSDLA